MLVHGTLPGMSLEPSHDAPPVEAAQALQPRHVDADLELLEADGALGRVDAVLLRSLVGEHARSPGQIGRRRRRRGAATRRRNSRPPRRSAAAVGGYARGYVRLALGLEVGQRAGRQLAVADGTLVLFRDLPPGVVLVGDGR